MGTSTSALQSELDELLNDPDDSELYFEGAKLALQEILTQKREPLLSGVKDSGDATPPDTAPFPDNVSVQPLESFPLEAPKQFASDDVIANVLSAEKVASPPYISARDAPALPSKPREEILEGESMDVEEPKPRKPRRLPGYFPKRCAWTPHEERALWEGVRLCGAGKWKAIKRTYRIYFQKRSPQNLKDKWRQLRRFSTAELKRRLGSVDKKVYRAQTEEVKSADPPIQQSPPAAPPRTAPPPPVVVVEIPQPQPTATRGVGEPSAHCRIPLPDDSTLEVPLHYTVAWVMKELRKIALGGVVETAKLVLYHGTTALKPESTLEEGGVRTGAVLSYCIDTSE